jgi:hypothetical protein
MLSEPDWNQLAADVNEGIATLRACWMRTATDTPNLHKRLVRDLYVPTLRLLSDFCAAVEIGEARDAE